MAYVVTTITLSPEEMELWRLKHPGESFSAWVRELVKLDVLPTEEIEVQPVGARQQPTKKEMEVLRCTNSPRYKDIRLKPEMCRVCGVAECEERLD